jgi:carboxypeptidase C (cathepsin A)
MKITARPLPRPAGLAPRPSSIAAVLGALLLAACGGGGGGGGGATPPPGGWLDATVYSTAANAQVGTPNELSATSHGTTTLGGTAVPWTATAGHLTAVDVPTGNPEASFFYVSYTGDGQPAATRPVTFFFNGGPGSASAWLHLGSFAPKRIATGVPDNTFPRAMPYVDNAESLIDTSDLVFVDAVGTGLSEAIAPFTNQSFWGVDLDAAVMRDFILRWRAANHREASPLYVFGESYGTVRGPVVVKYLETAGVPVAGLVLQSSILNYNSNCSVTGGAVASVSCAGFLPSYSAVGDFLGLLTPPPSDLPAFLDDVATFADTTYEPATQAWFGPGHPLPAPSVIDTLAADTGLPAANWNAQFNMDFDTFRHQIKPGFVAGVYDGRIVAATGSPLDANDEPSDTLISGPFTSTIGTVLASIGYTNPSTYVLLSDAINTWDFSHGGNAMPDVVPDLVAAMTLDPQLKVLSLNGEHDLITPFHQTALDLARLAPAQAARVAFRRYPGGHMTYLDDTGRPAEKADLVAFYAGTLPVRAAATTTRVAAVRAPAPATAATYATIDGRPVAHPLAVQAPAHARAEPLLPPLAVRQAAGRATATALSGAALDAQVRAALRAQFDRADVAHRGRLTAAQARAAGLGALANRFDAADVQHRGSVSFDEWMAALGR